MTDIEEQLRLYATAITDPDRPIAPVTERSGTAVPARRPAFLVAAAVLVVVVIATSVLVVRGQRETSRPAGEPASVSATRGSFTTTLTISTTAPAPDELVTATVAVTNTGSSERSMAVPCAISIGVMTDPPGQVTFATGSSWLDQQLSAQFSAGSLLPLDRQVMPALTIDEMVDAAKGDPAALTTKATGCDGIGRTAPVPAGGTVQVTKALTIGELGLPAGTGTVTSVVVTADGILSPAVDITIPRAPAGSIDRTSAIELVVSDPAVRQFIAGLPEGPPGSSSGTSGIVVGDPDVTTDRPGPAPGNGATLTVGIPVAGGWQIGYSDSERAFLAFVSTAGTLDDLKFKP